jgi:hypothetical protein
MRHRGTKAMRGMQGPFGGGPVAPQGSIMRPDRAADRRKNTLLASPKVRIGRTANPQTNPPEIDWPIRSRSVPSPATPSQSRIWKLGSPFVALLDNDTCFNAVVIGGGLLPVILMIIAVFSTG